MGAFSLIVTQFQSISSYAVALARVGALEEAAEHAAAPAAGARIEISECADALAWEGLTLRSPRDGRMLLRGLSARVVSGTQILVTGPDELRVALFRATAGIWDAGEGRIRRPPAGQLMFLPERPYLPPGTLREVLVRTGSETEIGDERIGAVLRELDLESVLARAGGLDVERDWDDLLSLVDHQLLLVVRLVLAAPRFAVLHGIGTTLGAARAASSLRLLRGAGISCVVLGEIGAAQEGFSAWLEVTAGGDWRWQALGPGADRVAATES
jgi:putative ATP-binding cassette transporter